jgi:hypothetical protein
MRDAKLTQRLPGSCMLPMCANNNNNNSATTQTRTPRAGAVQQP